MIDKPSVLKRRSLKGFIIKTIKPSINKTKEELSKKFAYLINSSLFGLTFVLESGIAISLPQHCNNSVLDIYHFKCLKFILHKVIRILHVKRSKEYFIL